MPAGLPDQGKFLKKTFVYTINTVVHQPSVPGGGRAGSQFRLLIRRLQTENEGQTKCASTAEWIVEIISRGTLVETSTAPSPNSAATNATSSSSCKLVPTTISIVL